MIIEIIILVAVIAVLSIFFGSLLNDSLYIPYFGSNAAKINYLIKGKVSKNCHFMSPPFLVEGTFFMTDDKNKDEEVVRNILTENNIRFGKSKWSIFWHIKEEDIKKFRKLKRLN
jgi:hypothetical protein